MLEQPLLGGNAFATAIAGDALVGSEYPVAGDDDRDGIGADSAANGPARTRSPGGAADVGVRHSGTERELAELEPHRSLKLSARGGKGEVKGATLAFEIFAELLSGVREYVARGLSLVIVGERASVLDGETRDVFAVARELNAADG